MMCARLFFKRMEWLLARADVRINTSVEAADRLELSSRVSPHARADSILSNHRSRVSFPLHSRTVTLCWNERRHPGARALANLES